MAGVLEVLARRGRLCRSPGRRRLGAIACLGLLGLVTPVSAKKGEVSRLERWRAEIADIDEKQKKGRAKRALRAAERLSTEVRQRGWRQPELDEILGELAAQAAIAEVNLDLDLGHATWLWHTALLLDGGVMNRDWPAYGRASKVLPELPLRALGSVLPGQKAMRQPFPSQGRFTRPRPREVEKTPELPLNRAARFEKRILRPTLEVIIHADGRVSHPAIKIGHSAKPTVLMAVLDMVWLMAPYHPAKVDDEPVDVVYTIEVDKLIFLRWDEMFDFY